MSWWRQTRAKKTTILDKIQIFYGKQQFLHIFNSYIYVAHMLFIYQNLLPECLVQCRGNSRGPPLSILTADRKTTKGETPQELPSYCCHTLNLTSHPVECTNTHTHSHSVLRATVYLNLVLSSCLMVCLQPIYKMLSMKKDLLNQVL